MQPKLDKDDAVLPGLAGRYQEALLLWLRWNDAYQRMNSELYQSRQDPQRIEQLMDQLDQLRQQAVKLSQELLDSADN